MAAWIFLVRKALQSGPSKASLRYRQALEHGSPADIARESLRRAVRELFFFWIALTIAAFLFFSDNGGRGDDQIFAAMVVALYLFLPAWTLYRLIRFALGR